MEKHTAYNENLHDVYVFVKGEEQKKETGDKGRKNKFHLDARPSTTARSPFLETGIRHSRIVEKQDIPSKREQ